MDFRAPLLAIATILASCAIAAKNDDRPKADAVTIKEDKQQVRFQVGEVVAATYQMDARFDKPFFWPVVGLDGERLTRPGWSNWQLGDSLDHPHHHSVWIGHGSVTLDEEGAKPNDFWLEGKKMGKIVCVETAKPNGDSITTRNEWRAPDGTKILDETRVLTLLVHDKNTRLLCIDIELHAVTGGVTFGDTKEGFLGVRVHDKLREKGGTGKVSNADGLAGAEKCWGKKSSWCDYSGKINNKSVGLALFDHPDNPSPACWHVRDYGLMSANPFGREKSGFPDAGKKETTLAKGERLKFRYALLIHRGDAEAAQINDHFERFRKR